MTTPPELIEAAKELGWRHSTSSPGRPATNGIAERAVRTVLEGARTVLQQSGLSTKWWSRAVRYYCLVYNVTYKARGAEGTPWELRHGEPFGGTLYPFGSQIYYMPPLKPAQDIANESFKFATPAVEGIFLGYYMNPGGSGLRTTSCWIERPLMRLGVQNM